MILKRSYFSTVLLQIFFDTFNTCFYFLSFFNRFIVERRQENREKMSTRKIEEKKNSESVEKFSQLILNRVVKMIEKFPAQQKNRALLFISGKAN